MRTITRRDWWLGVALVVLALVFHAVFPRYEVHVVADRPILRVDRWTGAIGRPPVDASLPTAAAVPTR